jgi:hypothetical protein
MTEKIKREIRAEIEKLEASISQDIEDLKEVSD